MSSNKQQYVLVDGQFTPKDALELIQVFFSQKINYNKIKNATHFVRYGEDSQELNNKIAYLQQSQQQIEDRIARAKQAGKSLQLNSILTIE